MPPSQSPCYPTFEKESKKYYDLRTKPYDEGMHLNRISYFNMRTIQLITSIVIPPSADIIPVPFNQYESPCITFKYLPAKSTNEFSQPLGTLERTGNI